MVEPPVPSGLLSGVEEGRRKPVKGMFVERLNSSSLFLLLLLLLLLFLLLLLLLFLLLLLLLLFFRLDRSDVAVYLEALQRNCS